MIVQRIALAAIAAAMLVAVAPEAKGAGGVVIMFCGVSVSTNAVLGQDLNCVGDGIVVNGMGITINLNGHTLAGDGGVSDNGVDNSGGFDKVTVKNGVVRNFQVGVYANDADHFSVSNVVASGNFFGFRLFGDSLSVASSNASGNSGNGMELVGNTASARSTIAVGNDASGIFLGGEGDKVTGVTVSGNGSNGLFGTADSVSVKSSTASGNGFSGIVLEGDAIQLKSNKTEANGFAIHDLSGMGISISAVSEPPKGKNVARGNDDPDQCQPAYLC